MNNTTTAITLNDRFSMIKNSPQQRGRGIRSRSMSQGRQSRPRQRGVDLRGSKRNQALLNQLERQHKMRMALKLKNKSILTTRGRFQGQIARTKLKRAAAIKKTMNARNFRQNNLTTFIPLNDTLGRMSRGRSRSRSRSRSRNIVQNIPVQERLGFPAGGRRRMRRGNQQLNGAQRSRSRSRSRVRLNRNNFQNGNQNLRKRSNSVNSRLGANGPANNIQMQGNRRRRFLSQNRGGNIGMRKNQSRLNRTMQGRVTKLRRAGNAMIRRNQAGNTIRNAKNFKRGGQQAGIVRKMKGGLQGQQGNARGRARNRGQRNNQQGQQQQQRRGRSRTRRGNNNNNRGGKQKISKEALDKQLDDYMAKGSA